MTRQSTATAIMMLAEEQQLRLEDSITKYFPEAVVRSRFSSCRLRDTPSECHYFIAQVLASPSAFAIHVCVSD
jgi:hypothetical protein